MTDTSKMSGVLRCKKTIIGIYTELFFIVEGGELSYYETEHHIYKGKYSLGGFLIFKNSGANKSAEERKTIRIKSCQGIFKTYLVLVANSPSERRRWVNAIQTNIDYANFHKLFSTPDQNSQSFSMRSDGTDPRVFSDDAENLIPENEEIEYDENDFGSAYEDEESQQDAQVLKNSSNSSLVERAKNVVASPDVLPSAVVRDRNTGQEIIFQYTTSPTDTIFPFGLYKGPTEQSSLQSCPQVCQGWLFKRGDIFKTLRKRYFILEKGKMKWFIQEPIDTIKSRPKGELDIFDYQLYSDFPAGKIRLILMPGYDSKVKRKLLLYCENYADKSMWVTAVNQHSNYDCRNKAV